MYRKGKPQKSLAILVSLCFMLTIFMGAVPAACSAEQNLPTDIKGHWAEDDISTMLGTGVVGGYPDGTFKPNRSITRAECDCQFKSEPPAHLKVSHFRSFKTGPPGPGIHKSCLLVFTITSHSHLLLQDHLATLEKPDLFLTGLVIGMMPRSYPGCGHCGLVGLLTPQSSYYQGRYLPISKIQGW